MVLGQSGEMPGELSQVSLWPRGRLRRPVCPAGWCVPDLRPSRRAIPLRRSQPPHRPGARPALPRLQSRARQLQGGPPRNAGRRGPYGGGSGLRANARPLSFILPARCPVSHAPRHRNGGTAARLVPMATSPSRRCSCAAPPAGRRCGSGAWPRIRRSGESRAS